MTLYDHLMYRYVRKNSFYASLEEKVKSGETLTEREMDILLDMIYRDITRSLEMEKVERSVLTKSMLILLKNILKIGGKRTRGIQSALEFGTHSFKDIPATYEEVLRGVHITSNYMTTENVKIVVEQIKIANQYRHLVNCVWDEIERQGFNEKQYEKPIAVLAQKQALEEREKVYKLSEKYQEK